MADLLRQGSDWLQAQRRAHMSRTVEYRRGTASVELSATVGTVAFDQETQSGIIERTESRDYLFDTIDLSLPGVGATLPKEGDQVIEEINGVRQRYEVMAIGGDPPWRFSDLGQNTIRVHTRRVGTA